MMKFSAVLFSCFFPVLLFAQQATFDWAHECGNPPNTTDTKTCMASGADGSFVVAGEFLNEAEFGTEILTSAGGTDVFIVKYSGMGDVLSAEQLGALDYDFVQDVEMDDQGNVFILGYFYGTTQIGSDQYTAFGSQDAFIAKMDNVGKVTWSEQIGGIMADYPSGLSLDDNGDLIVTGYFYSEISLGDTSITSTAGSDIYLARYSSDGTLIQVIQAGGSSGDQVRSVAEDPDGNIILTGSFYNDIMLVDTLLVTTDPVGVFVAKFNPSLELTWAFQLDGSYLNIEVYAEADHAGNLYVAGSFSEDIHFGTQTFSAGEFNQDIFLAKYDSDGNLQWARHGHSYASDQVVGLGVDENNNVYLTGHYLDTIHFDEVTLVYTLCCGSREVFIMNYTTDGQPWWGQQISGARTALHAMTVNSGNRVIMSGLFTEDVYFGTHKLSSFEGFKNFVTCLTGDIFTAIAHPISNFSFSIYPNPADHQITINSQVKIIRAEIFNIMGSNQLIVMGKNIHLIDLSGLAPGTYLLRVTTETGDTGTARVMLAR